MAFPTSFLPILRKGKLRSEFLDYERTNSPAMQPTYLLTFILSVNTVTIFREFGLQVARLKMRGTQIPKYRVLYGFGPAFAELATWELEWFHLIS